MMIATQTKLMAAVKEALDAFAFYQNTPTPHVSDYEKVVVAMKRLREVVQEVEGQR